MRSALFAQAWFWQQLKQHHEVLIVACMMAVVDPAGAQQQRCAVDLQQLLGRGWNRVPVVLPRTLADTCSS
jgi:hypothetical protein